MQNRSGGTFPLRGNFDVDVEDKIRSIVNIARVVAKNVNNDAKTESMKSGIEFVILTLNCTVKKINRL